MVLYHKLALVILGISAKVGVHADLQSSDGTLNDNNRKLGFHSDSVFSFLSARHDGGESGMGKTGNFDADNVFDFLVEQEKKEASGFQIPGSVEVEDESLSDFFESSSFWDFLAAGSDYGSSMTRPPTSRPTYAENTRPPTLRPTRPPTGRPTRPPTGQPTKPPTPPPTRQPTKPPTNPPTCKPGEYGCGESRPPTPRPTRITTRAPTPSPTCKPGDYGCGETPPPTPRPPSPQPPEECLVDVTIDCTEIGRGRECYRLLTPSSLSCGEDIETLAFSYIPGRCSQSANTQDDSCEDFGGGPSGRGFIECNNNEGETVFEGPVNVGGTFTVPGPLSGALTCDISNAIGQIRQSVRIDTSGNEDVYLKDIYGSLQLESCNTKNCLVPVEYTYTVRNIHTAPMTLTELTRTIFARREINGESQGGTQTRDLINQVDDTFLRPGEETTVMEESLVDVCVEGEYETIVVVKADPPEGLPCEATDEYEIITTGKDCRVDVEITCEDEEGTDCDDIESSLSCNVGLVIQDLTFTYLGGRCSQSSNTQDEECEDLNGGPSRRRDMRIVCHSGDDDDTTILFFNDIVSVGQTFTVTNDAPRQPLPREVVCEIVEPEGGEKRQCVTIATRGAEELFLKDVFGSLRVERCDNKSCSIPIAYTYTLENVGQTSMTIDRFQLTRGGSTEDLLDEIDDKDLEFGETRVLRDEDTIDVCVEDVILTSVAVEASPPEGDTCLDVDSYVLETGPGKVCRVDIEITCEDEDERDCDEIPTPSSFDCNDSGCVNEVAFTYSARKCESRDGCVDFTDDIIINSYIRCTDGIGRSLFEGRVDLGDTVDLEAESGIFDVKCEIFRSRFGARVQEVNIDMCNDLSLTEHYGSLRLEACDERKCIIPIEYTYSIQNIGTLDMEITELTRSRGVRTTDLLNDLEDTILGVDEMTTITETDRLDVCLSGVITTTVNVEADTSEGSPCTDEDNYEIVIEVDPTPAPIPPLSQSPSGVGEQCFISVDAECTPSGLSQDCGSVVVTRTRCEGRPLAMVFRFNGGTCEQSDNIQNANLFQCFDFRGGPPTEVGETVFLVATDIKGGEIVYHADTVAVGEEYTVSDQPFEVEPNINITIWSSPAATPDLMLQTLVFHSSCSQNLFLKDRFGASQLVVFVNEPQGLQSCFFNATFTINISNDIKGSGATLQRLSSATNYGLFNFTNEVNGLFLPPGETFSPSPSFDIVIDLTVVTNNEILTVITATSEFDNICSDSDFYTFVTGLALPPNIPTRSPTSSPTRTPLPTPDPEETACSIQSIVSCDVENGGGLLDCDNIARPNNLICRSGGFPRELEFIYRGGNCNDSTNSQAGFICNGNANRNEVWITIISNNQNILWNRVTQRNTFMDLRGVDELMQVTISTVVNGRVGEPLQEMTIASSCENQSQLRLQDTFGALQLAEFTTVDRNNVATVNAAFANVVITYAVSLTPDTSIRARIASAVSSGGPVNDQTTTNYPAPDEQIEPREPYVFGTQEAIIDLLDQSSLFSYNYTLQVIGQSAQNPTLLCFSRENVEFSIA